MRKRFTYSISLYLGLFISFVDSASAQSDDTVRELLRDCETALGV